ncbi:MAG: hypothetical protein ACFBSE_17845 [Prochloraceae cyanobacterium]
MIYQSSPKLESATKSEGLGKNTIDNIAIATSNQLPDRLKEFDTVIFDVRSRNSPNIKLIKDIDYTGSIVVFAPGDLPPCGEG